GAGRVTQPPETEHRPDEQDVEEQGTYLPQHRVGSPKPALHPRTGHHRRSSRPPPIQGTSTLWCVSAHSRRRLGVPGVEGGPAPARSRPWRWCTTLVPGRPLVGDLVESGVSRRDPRDNAQEWSYACDAGLSVTTEFRVEPARVW